MASPTRDRGYSWFPSWGAMSSRNVSQALTVDNLRDAASCVPIYRPFFRAATKRAENFKRRSWAPVSSLGLMEGAPASRTVCGCPRAELRGVPLLPVASSFSYSRYLGDARFGLSWGIYVAFAASISQPKIVASALSFPRLAPYVPSWHVVASSPSLQLS